MIASQWTPDYQKKADRIQYTAGDALDQMLHVALENPIKYEGTNQDRQLYWLRCAMLAQDEIARRGAISAWLIKNGFPLTRETWIQANWMFEAILNAATSHDVPRSWDNSWARQVLSAR